MSEKLPTDSQWYDRFHDPLTPTTQSDTRIIASPVLRSFTIQESQGASVDEASNQQAKQVITNFQS
jgi:hypothetical protein